MLPKTTITRRETKSRKEGRLSCISKSESAAATAVIAILLLGLIFTIVSVVRLEHVPEWKNDAEQNYMYDTLDDMGVVKTNIDILSKLMESNNSSSNNISVTAPVDLGGGEIPFLEPIKSDGKFEVNTERYAMTVVLRSLSQKITPDNFTVECGGITCYSENKQYPNQIFRYENGALILANGRSSTMRQPPAITIENETNEDNYTVIIQTVQLSGKRDSTSSNTVVPLQLTGYKTEPVFDSNDYKNTSTPINAFNLTIATRYPDAWIGYFNEIAQEKGLKPEEDYIVRCLKDSGHVRFSFLPNSTKSLERLYVSKATIGAELGEGNNYSCIGNVMKLNQWYCFDTFTGTYSGTTLSPSPDPANLTDSNYVTPSLPPESFTNTELSPYNSKNEFSQYLGKKENIDLTLGFNDYTKFESTPSKATVLIIYKYENDDPTKYSDPTMEMSLAGVNFESVNDFPMVWRVLYDTKTFTVSPTSPSDLIFNLKAITKNNQQGTFYIDYLAVYLS
ncbi:hypothetical protein MSKOL_0495 [Methanosarcina sp. Kolksee]|uniref:DUF7289 family protein n=1 Tax=Methanosarcina sp. Kolksee TaxID=1434099 RepID=UPI0006161D9B|nr:hypothetical protein [Methanosarcina sp. Kolksee]AKB46272.1 hypothetical protein MSKOL_0495 [Methanosarcina sp. Kolksee]